jgi:RiboL-PSP-HEPN
VSPPRTRYVDRRAEIGRRKRDVDALILLAAEAEDPEVQQAVVRLAIVRLSGFIEVSVRHMIHGYCEEHTTHRVLKFAIAQVAKLPNLASDALIKTVGQFDVDWADTVREYLDGEERKQDLNNLIGARHLVAHGEDGTLTLKTLWRYQALVEGLIAMLQDMFLPLPTKAPKVAPAGER